MRTTCRSKSTSRPTSGRWCPTSSSHCRISLLGRLGKDEGILKCWTMKSPAQIKMLPLQVFNKAEPRDCRIEFLSRPRAFSTVQIFATPLAKTIRTFSAQPSQKRVRMKLFIWLVLHTYMIYSALCISPLFDFKSVIAIPVLFVIVFLAPILPPAPYLMMAPILIWDAMLIRRFIAECS